MSRNNRDLGRWLMREIWGQHAPVPRKPPKKETRGPARNWKYRAWIRSLPCAACGTTPAGEAAHTGVHGLSQKASDYSCIPLCSDCHRFGSHAYHRIGRQGFEERHDLDIANLLYRLNRAWFNQWKLGS